MPFSLESSFQRLRHAAATADATSQPCESHLCQSQSTDSLSHGSKTHGSKSHGAESVHWDLSDLYASPTDPKLEDDKASLLTEAEALAKEYRGKMASLDASGMLALLDRYESLLQTAHRLGSYAHLIWSTNTEDASLGKLVQEMSELGSEISQHLVFIDVEWLAVDEKQAQSIIDDPILAHRRHYLVLSRRFKDHTLSEQAEQVMSAKRVTGRSAWVRYFDETLGAARFEWRGEKLPEQQVLSKLHDPNRETRKEAHASLTKGFQEHKRTLTYVFNTILADKMTSDKLRGYEHWDTTRHLSNETDHETVQALIDAVTGSYHLPQRVYSLKSKLLGLDPMFDYDRYAPLMQTETTIQWSEAQQMVLDAYSEFHPEMGTITQKFFDHNWIDAAVKPGKRGGAYSASVSTDTHPYILMNYNGQLRDVQTLAHELGHGVHQYLSRQQGELQSGTPLTTAETASVFGEMLVFERMIAALDDPKEKLALVLSKLDDTIATVYRQISMNRFENRIHTHRRSKGELTTEQFSEHWMDTQRALYGDSVTMTEEYGLWWCYIPHFLHTPGYVYAYAFGELLVLALSEQYKQAEDKEAFAETYMGVLASGGSRWPHELIAEFGLDIRDPKFWNTGITVFERLIEQAESLSKEIS